MEARRNPLPGSGPDAEVVNLLKENLVPLPPIPDGAAGKQHGPAAAGPSFGSYFDRFGDCKVLLIGDASHGTSEFYAARAEITKYMIEHHGFNIVATESDWPDAERVDRYVRRRRGPAPHGSVKEPDAVAGTAAEPAFKRFPTWMWRNMEVHDFVEWLREHNKGKKVKDAVGFYGLDLYSMGTSMAAVIGYLDRVDPQMAKAARKAYAGLMVWAEHPQEYGLQALVTSFRGYEAEVISMLKTLLAKRLEYSEHHADGDEFHGGEQNARVVADAEEYYRAMYYGRDESWNLRDTHMFHTLVRTLKYRGAGAKAIVWAHNSHLGDARATSMGSARGEINVGQLCKENFGDQVLSIGCSTYTGTVAAADNWDDDMQVMKVRPALPNSYELLLHQTGVPSFLLDLRPGPSAGVGGCSEELRQALMRQRLERFIGVIYRPDTERQSHYSWAVLPKQFDGIVWFDETKAVRALEIKQPHTPLEMDETWPFGL